MTMALASTLKDCLRNWQILLVGLLLSTSPILGAATTAAPTTSTGSSATTTTTAPATTTPTTPTPATTAATSATTAATIAPTTPTTSATTTTTTAAAPTAGTTTTVAPPATTATSGTTSTTTAAPTTAATTASSATTPASTVTSMSSTTTAGATATTAGAATMSMTTSAAVSSSATSNSSMTTMGNSTSMGNSTGWSTGTTSGNNSSMSTISCRSFMCNYSDCYSMYMNQNASMCPPGYDCCELMKLTDMCYQVGCSASCSMRCNGTSQTNCSVDCCNSTNCLNNTFMSMMMTTTTTPMMTTTSRATTRPTTTTTTAAPTTPAGKKCHKGQCNGTDCYKDFNTHQVCSSSQPHCQLKKESVGSAVQWTAGCTTNCSGQTPCMEETKPPCFLECCNATLASSCLFMNGSVNYPSSATRGPQLLTPVLLVFVISLML